MQGETRSLARELRQITGRAALALALGCGAGCDQPIRYWVCDELKPARLRALPSRLSDTGLYAVLASETLAAGVEPYTPRFGLWSDGSTKRRWIQLPEGQRIDTANMDAWLFPEGTRLWKEFTRDGIRVETRLLEKVGPDDNDWLGLAYLWADDQHDAYAAPYGAIDVQGTPHNVPAASECMACHGGTKSRVLGFSAIQLAGAFPTPSLDLHALVERGLLTNPPSDLDAVLPGTAVEQAALGYLHANCAHCHNRDRPLNEGARCFDPETELDFRLLTTGLQQTASTNTYLTMGDVVTRGRPSKSRLFELVSHRGLFDQMPPLASERVDEDALATLGTWIGAL